MTVSSTSSRVVANGDGVNTSWPFAFKIPDSSSIVVVYTDATGTDHALSYGTDYGATGFGVDAGGTVTYPLSGSPIAVGTQLTIYRNVAVTQPTSISNQGAMWPSVIEAALDRLTFVAQKVTDGLSRALVISPTDGLASLNELPSQTNRRNSVLGFDGDGQPYAATLTGSLLAVATWLVQNFLNAGTSAQAACAALLAAYLPGDNIFSGNNTFSGTNTFPTQSASDGSTRAATTAYADRAAANAVGNPNRNRLINGEFAIDQRNEGASQTFTAAAAAAYAVDRWYASCTGANVTGQRVAGTSPNPFAWLFTGAASNTGLLFGQRIESANSADLVNQAVVCQIRAKSSALTSLTWTAWSANAADSWSSRTQIATGTLAIGPAPAAASFSFNTGANAANGIAIEFTGGALLATQTLQVELAQLQLGSVPGALETRSLRDRLADCRRYYQKSYDAVAPGTATHAGMVMAGTQAGGTGNAMGFAFDMPMRATPTMASWDGAGNANKASQRLSGAWSDNLAAVNFVAIGTRSVVVEQTGGAQGAFVHYTATAEL